MTTDLGADDVVVHIGGPQIISSETAVTSCVVTRGHVAGGGGGGGGAELGRRLLVAAREGDTAAVLELMAKGTPFTTDWLGTSPLHLAASNAHLETCAVLVRAGVSRDSRTKVDRTPLHLAAYEGHERVVALLLEHGALVDCRDMLRMTPLHWAAQRGHAGAARELLRRGADPTALSKFGATPLSLARRSPLGERSALARLLEDATRAREAARSVRALVSEQNMSETQSREPQLQTFETVQKIQESGPTQKQAKSTRQLHLHHHQHQQQQQQDKASSARTEQPPEGVADSEGVSESGGGGGGEGAAARLLRRHGITLLPADEGTTVLSALQSGRSVVLSDAGKLMLKESGEKSAATPSSGKGVVLTATAVTSPPRAGVKIFTLNNNLLLPADPAAPAAGPAAPRPVGPRSTATQNLQVKYVQLPAEGRAVGARVRRPPATPRPVKIILNRANFTKLLSPLSSAAAVGSSTSPAARPDRECAAPGQGAAAVALAAGGGRDGVGEGQETGAGAVAAAESVLRVTDEWVVECSQKQLRAHALQARQALAALLRVYRAPR